MLFLYFIVIVDASAAVNLELIQNARDPKSGDTLHGVLNHTKTAGGGEGLTVKIHSFSKMTKCP